MSHQIGTIYSEPPHMLDPALQALTDMARVQARLEREKRKPANEHQPAAKIAELPRPDALVLCTVEVHCDSCGQVHQYPSQHLLLRHGRNYTHTGRSEAAYANVPKEWIIKRTNAVKCRFCFGQTNPTIIMD